MQHILANLAIYPLRRRFSELAVLNARFYIRVRRFDESD